MSPPWSQEAARSPHLLLSPSPCPPLLHLQAQHSWLLGLETIIPELCHSQAPGLHLQHMTPAPFPPCTGDDGMNTTLELPPPSLPPHYRWGNGDPGRRNSPPPPKARKGVGLHPGLGPWAPGCACTQRRGDAPGKGWRRPPWDCSFLVSGPAGREEDRIGLEALGDQEAQAGWWKGQSRRGPLVLGRQAERERGPDTAALVPGTGTLALPRVPAGR